MVKWLDCYEQDTVDNITCLGLFKWKYTPNKRKPENPKKHPVLDANQKLFIRTLPLDYGIYFQKVSDSSLQVLHILEQEHGVKSTAFEYHYDGENFSKAKKGLI